LAFFIFKVPSISGGGTHAARENNCLPAFSVALRSDWSTVLTEPYKKIFVVNIILRLQVARDGKSFGHFGEHVQLPIEVAALEADYEMIFELRFFLVRERPITFHAQYF
jgi:hypothetical protein